jgi:hypothetical protein
LMRNLITVLVAVTALAFPIAAQANVFSDPAGDTKARDLDIRTVKVSRSGANLRVEFTLAANARDNSIYSAMIICGKKSWQLAAIRENGMEHNELGSLSAGGKALPAPQGSIAGNHVTLNAPANKMGCMGKVEMRFIAERASGSGDLMTDSVPKQRDPVNGNWFKLWGAVGIS